MAEQRAAEIWADRVRAWRESGQTAAAFSAGRDFAPGTLKVWASRLQTQRADAPPSVPPPRRGRPPKSKAAGAVTDAAKTLMLARVVRSEPVDTPASRASAPVEVLVGDVRVRVDRGADELALRLVFRALGVAP
jgi:hypothetical protein